MTTPVQQGIITGGYLFELRDKINKNETNLLFHDYYTELFEPLGIYRDELMLVLPQALRVDLLTGTDNVPYKKSEDKKGEDKKAESEDKKAEDKKGEDKKAEEK